MCDVLESYRKAGIEEGRAEGRENAIIENLRSMMRKMNTTLEQAMDILDVPVEMHEHVRALI